VSWKLTLHPSSDWAKSRGEKWTSEGLTAAFERVKSCDDREAAARLEAVAAIATARVALLEEPEGSDGSP